MSRPPRAAVALTFLLSVSALPAQSSCPYAWAAGYENEGYFNGTQTMGFFDLGGGPKLYAAGALRRGGTYSGNVACFDGQSWTPLGSGFLAPNPAINSGTINALAVYDDGTGPALYAGGGFVSADGHPVSNIAKWDGTTWVAVGSGVNDHVEALVVHHDGVRSVLFAAGLVWLSRQGADVRRVLTEPRTLGLLALSTLAIFVNWTIYVVAVAHAKVIEASLGYYINPLLNMAVGALFFRERMPLAGKIAIALATIGVAAQTFALGHLPLIAAFAAFVWLRLARGVRVRLNPELAVFFLLLWLGIVMRIGNNAGRVAFMASPAAVLFEARVLQALAGHAGRENRTG